MRYLIYIFLLMTATSTAWAQCDSTMKIMTFNIRLDHKPDSIQGNGWGPHRKESVAALIKHYSPDLLGVQEAFRHQLDYIIEQNPEYSLIGEGRDDGKEGGEYSAILYKKDKFKVLESRTFWLSPTPDKPSKAWDAAFPRIVTWGKFKAIDSEKEFIYMNTHFDHVGTEARAESAKMIVEKAKEVSQGLPVILTGDFNATPDAEPYKIITKYFKDAAKISQKPAYGPEGTFSGFDLMPDADFRRIDYIFTDKAEVLSHQTINDYSGSKFPSDHLPVMAEIELK